MFNIHYNSIVTTTLGGDTKKILLWSYTKVFDPFVTLNQLDNF